MLDLNGFISFFLSFKYMKSFTLIAAYRAEDFEPVAGIPDKNGTFGSYTAKQPQDAFSKAYSNVLQYIKRYRSADIGWFTDYGPNEPLVLVGYGLDTDKIYAYYCTRYEAPQGRREWSTIQISTGKPRNRVYNWRNRLIPMKTFITKTTEDNNLELESIDDAIMRHERRSEKSVGFNTKRIPEGYKSGGQFT